MPFSAGTQFVNVADARVSYRVDGQGPGLVLVSGTGGNLQSNWDHLIQRFSAHRRVLRVDYSGAGDTQDGGGSLCVGALAQQVMGASEAADMRQFDLVGYSLGACVAAYIAAEHTQRVRSVVLLAGFMGGKEDTRLNLQFDLWLHLIREDPRSFARLVLLTGFSPAFLNRLSTQELNLWQDAICTSNRWDGISRQIELDKRVDVRAHCARISQPTLVIGCTNDFMVPVDHAKALAASISGARYEELPSGHLAPFERPDEFATLVETFLREVARDA